MSILSTNDNTANRLPLRYGSLCVLVIEDAITHRMLLNRMLEKLGVKMIYEAVDGSQGMDLARQVKPDLIICDIMMEPMNGFGFLRALRTDPETAALNTPVVMASAISESGAVMKASVLEGNAYVLKPFRLHQLQTAIERVFPGANGTANTVERPVLESMAC